MLGDRRTTATEVCGDLTDCEPIVTQESKDLPASGISDGAKNCVMAPMFNGNHLATEIVTDRLRLSMSRLCGRRSIPTTKWRGPILKSGDGNRAGTKNRIPVCDDRAIIGSVRILRPNLQPFCARQPSLVYIKGKELIRPEV